MRQRFCLRSGCFRVVLGMALLAWAAFALDAFAHPFMMDAAPVSHVSTIMGNMPSQGDSMSAMAMPNTSHDPAPMQPVGNGHGCCQNAHCYCASFCGGVAGAARIAVTFEPPQGPTLAFVGHGPAPTRFTVLLRPPIA